MFGIDSSELMVIALVALLVIGPKDLPRAMRWVGQWVGKARAMSRHLRSGFDTMMREAELEEMQKVWAAQNEAIMKATHVENPFSPATPVSDDWMQPPADSPVTTATDALPAAQALPAPKPRRVRKPRAPKAVAPAQGPDAA